MERLACVDLPEFPLQLLLARHPEWKRLPAAVVAEDKPQGEILWVSPGARAAGVLPGMRYAQGLSLATGLRAAEVSTEEVCSEVEELADLLRRFSPDVEVSGEEPGVFWVNADGLSGLFLSLEIWARKIHAALTARGRQASVVVGFRRFAAYAVAKGRKGVLVLSAPDEEEAAPPAGPSGRPCHGSPFAGHAGEARHSYRGRISATAGGSDTAPVRQPRPRVSMPLPAEGLTTLSFRFFPWNRWPARSSWRRRRETACACSSRFRSTSIRSSPGWPRRARPFGSWRSAFFWSGTGTVRTGSGLPKQHWMRH